MYEAFYGLREKPFNLTPDPRFLFLSDKHKEAFAHLLYGIKYRSGFVEITGDIGTGKTTICRTLLRQIDPKTEVAFIFNPGLSEIELLKSINEDFGIASKGTTKKELIDELNTYLVTQRSKGKNAVLVIDEAQNLAPEVLEQVRLLSNLETETEKLLQIILLGQPELRALLSLPELRQLDQRITARYHLKPLDERESVQYIAHRLKKAGAGDTIKFTRGALKRIFAFSGGTPRLINAVCDRALLIGYNEETKRINKKIIQKAEREIRGDLKVGKKAGPSRVFPARLAPYAALTVVLAMVAAFGLGTGYIYYTSYQDTLAVLNRVAEADNSTPDPAPVSVALSLPAPEEAVPLDEPPEVPNPEAFLEKFMELARNVDLPAARANAVDRMLKLWGVELRPDVDPAVDRFIDITSLHGMRCSLVRANINMLKALDYPFVMQLFLPGETQPLYLSVARVVDDKAMICLGEDEVQEMSFEVLENYWYGKAYIFWRDFAVVEELLAQGQQGKSVEWVQQALHNLGYYRGEMSGVYDDQTREAVRQFQSTMRLDDDGVVGPETRMAIYSADPRYPTPSLRAVQSEVVVTS